jgi:hypothetical protein
MIYRHCDHSSYRLTHMVPFIFRDRPALGLDLRALDIPPDAVRWTYQKVSCAVCDRLRCGGWAENAAACQSAWSSPGPMHKRCNVAQDGSGGWQPFTRTESDVMEEAYQRHAVHGALKGAFFYSAWRPRRPTVYLDWVH